jgi:hypothetical protein
MFIKIRMIENGRKKREEKQFPYLKYEKEDIILTDEKKKEERKSKK